MDDLIARLRKMAMCIYIAVEESVADDIANGLTKAADHIEKLEAENARLRRCLLPVQMTLAQAECVDEPIPDDAVVLHFMGSGASDQVTAGEIRAAFDTAPPSPTIGG